MDLFQYFEEEHKFIEERLYELEKDYDKWSAERVFVRSTKMFDAIQKHFDKQETLILKEIGNVPEMQDIVGECLSDRKQIVEAIEDLVMDHIDSNEYRSNLSKLLKSIRRHISFSDEKLYQSIREHVPADKLKSLNDAVKEEMFA